jgi:tetratricopeptide (TPR) repeat protein
MCQLYLGDVYSAKNDFANSILFYEKAFKSRPNDSTLINNLATVYYSSNLKEKCLNFSNRIIAKDPKNIAAWENLGYFYLAEKDTLSSKKYFKKAIELGLNTTTIPVGLF